MNESQQMTYLNKVLGPLPFCPGCGHTPLSKSLDKALIQLKADPSKTVLVTDIGCIGLTDKYFTTSAFHGLHGRSITYASGLKLARPDLMVIAIKGDGGCGIGGTPLLNVARRNIGITLIVANNFNYGMTGGQHSVTTPTGAVTATTPWGTLEAPLDLCATTIAAGASWVYRATIFDKTLPDIITEAIRQPGFSMIDVWEPCTAYYQQHNEADKEGLLALVDRLGFKLGLLVDRPRPEYSESYYKALEAGKKALQPHPRIEPRHAHGLERQTGIIIAGSAGQRIRSTSSLFAEGAILSRLMATQKDDYPITVQTGHSISEVILSPKRIEYTQIDSPDILVLLSDDGIKQVRKRMAALAESCTVYAESSLELPTTRARIRRYPFVETARKVSRQSVATVALAAILEETGFYPMEAFREAIQAFQAPSIAETNLNAATAGRDLARKPGSNPGT